MFGLDAVVGVAAAVVLVGNTGAAVGRGVAGAATPHAASSRASAAEPTAVALIFKKSRRFGLDIGTTASQDSYHYAPCKLALLLSV